MHQIIVLTYFCFNILVFFCLFVFSPHEICEINVKKKELCAGDIFKQNLNLKQRFLNWIRQRTGSLGWCSLIENFEHFLPVPVMFVAACYFVAYSFHYDDQNLQSIISMINSKFIKTLDYWKFTLWILHILLLINLRHK